MDIVNTVVNANNAFISSLDHLPCDIVRSLWLIQSLSLKNVKIRARLDEICQDHPSQEEEPEVRKLFALLSRNSRECLQEAKQIELVLQDHQGFLANDREVLEKVSQNTVDYEKQWATLCDERRKFVAEHESEITEPAPVYNQMRSLKLHLHLKSHRVKTEPKRGRGRPRKYPVGYQPIKISVKKIKQQEPELVEEEPIYCFCQSPASGRMVCCDNPKCKYEWFHYKCVGLKTDPDPKSKWFCSDTCHDQYYNALKRRKKRRRTGY